VDEQKIISEQNIVDTILDLVDDLDKNELVDLYNYLFPSGAITIDDVEW